MVIGRIACALGRHRIDRDNIRKVSGRETARCKSCRRVLEQEAPGIWNEIPLHDAGLGHRPR